MTWLGVGLLSSHPYEGDRTRCEEAVDPRWQLDCIQICSSVLDDTAGRVRSLQLLVLVGLDEPSFGQMKVTGEVRRQVQGHPIGRQVSTRWWCRHGHRGWPELFRPHAIPDSSPSTSAAHP